MLARLGRVYFGWWIVGTVFLLSALSAGVYHLGFTVFFLPLVRELQVSRTAASLPFTLARLVSVGVFTSSGLAADRVGPAKVALVGGVLAGTGFLLLKASDSYAIFLLVYLVAITPGIQSGYETPAFVALSRWSTRGPTTAVAYANIDLFVKTPRQPGARWG